MKYRKLPVDVEAIEWTGGNTVEVYNFLENKNVESQSEITTEGKNFRIQFDNGGCRLGSLMIKTLEGEMKVDLGDYIIKGVKGEFYPCKLDIFEKTYEKVQEKNADEMFEKLEYRKEAGKHNNLYYDDLHYIKKDTELKDFFVHIDFYVCGDGGDGECCKISAYRECMHEYKTYGLSFSEIEAIYKKVKELKELGWN